VQFGTTLLGRTEGLAKRPELRANPNAAVQNYAEGSHGTRAKPNSGKLCPTNNGGKNWEPSAYNPELGLLYIPSIEGYNYLELVVQEDMADQGGPVQPRDRFTGGSPRPRIVSTAAVDPTTGETKAVRKLDYPNMAGALATAGNLVFLGHYDGTFSAYDAKTLNEMWSFNVGSPIQAPPISYAVNGKRYVAILVGALMWPFIIQNAPELKNQTAASMLYVFAL
jgi:alcohol dehydrogenase (cytochrome c)